MKTQFFNKKMKFFYITLIAISSLLLFLRRVEGFTTERYYTVKPPTYDGFGAQYHAVMSGIAYCNREGLTYVHTPFQEIGHHGDTETLNKFIGIPAGNPQKDMVVEPHSEDVHWSERPSEYYTENVVQQLRDAYYSTDKPDITPPDIAIHIRRGDVKNGDTERFTSNDAYKKLIDTLHIKYPDYNVIIYSEGKEADFSEIASDKTQFRLNETLTDTFHGLVTAKVLVMAKSSLSYAAAILNENTVYYQDFWHKPLDHWNKI
jgi:hypothetical protein